MTLAAIKVITFLRQHRRIAGKCGRIARHIHNTFTIRCGKANKAYAASAHSISTAARRIKQHFIQLRHAAIALGCISNKSAV